MVRTIGIEPDPAKRIRKRQGRTIADFRKMRGMSVDELANLVEVTPGAIRHWEGGRYSPRQHHQVRLAKALNTTWGSLFALDGEAA